MVIIIVLTLSPAVARAPSHVDPEPGAMKLSIPAGKMLGVSMALSGGYGALFLAAPVLGYKIFFKGTVLPGMTPPDDEKTPPEPKPVAVQIMRWFGTAILWGVLGTYMNSDGATKNLKTNLNQQAILWATAGAAHAVPHVQGTQPKELCIQQYVLMAATAAACAAAADGVDETA